MNLLVRSSAKNDASTGTNITVNEPSGAQVGDLILVFVHGNAQSTITDNNGSTPFINKWIDDYKPNTSNGHVMACFSRRKRAGDPSSYSFTLGASGRWAVVSMAVYDGDGDYVNFDVIPSTANASNTDNSSSGQMTNPAITTGVNNAMHITVGGWDTSAIGTISTPSGYTLVQNANNNNGEPLHVSYKIITSAGSTGTTVIDNTEFGARIGYSFSLKAVKVVADVFLRETKTTDATSALTTSFTPVANKAYFIAVATKTEITANPNQPTASGAGLTWTVPTNGSEVYDNASSSRRRFTVLQGVGSSPSAGQVTIDLGGQTQTGFAWLVVEVLGANATTPVVQSAKNSNQSSNTSITATLGAFANANNATLGFFANGRGDLTISVGSGFVKIGEIKEQAEGNFDVVASYRPDNDTTVDFSYASDAEMGVIALELNSVLSATANDTRPFKVTGTDTANDSRPFKTTGKETANDARNFKLTGAEGANDNRPFKVTGTDTANDARDFKTTGKETANDERGFKLTGTDNVNDSRNFKTTGSESANDNRPFKTTGQDLGTDTRPMKVTGQDTANDTRPFKLTGAEGSDDARNFKLTGTDTSNDSRNFKLTGGIVEVDSRNFKTTGQDTANDSRPFKTTGALGDTSERNLKTTGQDTANDNRPFKLTGVDSAFDSIQMKVTGKETSNDARDFKLTGTDSANSTRPFKLTGSELNALPEGVIVVWDDTHASIPEGYVRETSLDDKYPKGTADATDPNTTGGNATHSHSASANHSHTENNHTHTIDLLNTSTDMAGRATGTNVWQHHAHTQHSSGNVTGGGLSSVSATYASVSNDPPHHEVIFIRSLGTHAVPDGAIALYDYLSGALPTDWDDYTTLHDKFIKGASTDEDAGDTGGSTTNVHTLTHTHTVTAHGHSAVTSPSASPSYVNDGWGGVSTGVYTGSSAHTHSTSLNNATPTISATVDLTTSETVEPAYTKLMAIQNNTGGTSRPVGVIGLWLGTLADIPDGWFLCDGSFNTIDMRDRHLKIGDSTEVGDTGGSNTHTHASQTHGHTSDNHTHTATSSQHPNYNDFGAGENYHSALGVLNTTVHPATIGSAQSTYADASTSADSSNNEPPYRTVAFIKFMGTLETSERNFKLTGTDTANSERPFKLTGTDTAQEDRPFKLTGYDTIQESRNFKLTGKESASSERGFRMRGIIGWTKQVKPSLPTWSKEEKPDVPIWTKEDKPDAPTWTKQPKLGAY